MAISLLAPLFLCLCPLLYFFALPPLDAAICVPRVAERLGVQPNTEAILVYVTQQVRRGMTRDEVAGVLTRIGSINVRYGTVAYAGVVTDVIRVQVCLLPVNHFDVVAHYAVDGRLESIEIPSS